MTIIYLSKVKTLFKPYFVEEIQVGPGVYIYKIWTEVDGVSFGAEVTEKVLEHAKDINEIANFVKRKISHDIKRYCFEQEIKDLNNPSVPKFKYGDNIYMIPNHLIPEDKKVLFVNPSAFVREFHENKKVE